MWTDRGGARDKFGPLICGAGRLATLSVLESARSLRAELQWQLLKVALHGFARFEGVPLPIRDLACDPQLRVSALPDPSELAGSGGTLGTVPESHPARRLSRTAPRVSRPQ